MCVGGVVYVCVQTICFRSLGVNLVYLPALTEIFFLIVKCLYQYGSY